jgi:hypothetical protein
MNKRSKDLERDHSKTKFKKKENRYSKVVLKLRKRLFSNIKNRSKIKNIRNEISKDIEKITLEPEELLLIEYIDINIPKKNNKIELNKANRL